MGKQKGLTLVEVLIAVAVLAIIASGIFTALHVSLRTTAIANERTTAESLTRTQLEYIKQCDYDDINNPPVYGLDPTIIATMPAGFSMVVTAERLDPSNNGTDDDEGIQKVTVGVSYEGELVVATESYKVKR